MNNMVNVYTNFDLLREVNQDAFEKMKKLGADLMNILAGFTPDEGEVVTGELLLNLDGVATHDADSDRIADLELGLFTNSSPGETITEATITEPTGGGYARKTLSDGSWTPTGSVFNYAQQTFTFTGTVTGSVQGYFIATNKAGTGVKRLIAVEVDSGGPYSFVLDDTYKITPGHTFS